MDIVPFISYSGAALIWGLYVFPRVWKEMMHDDSDDPDVIEMAMFGVLSSILCILSYPVLIITLYYKWWLSKRKSTMLKEQANGNRTENT
jgi:hypothetical protein